MNIKLKLKNVRFSYANVWEPKGIDGGAEKYSVAILIPRKDTATLIEIEKAMATIKKETTYLQKGLVKMPLRDGSVEKKDDDVYNACLFMNASSTTPPGIVGPDVKPIMDRKDFYSGCYGHVTVTLYPFNKEGNKGIAVGLNNIMKTADGERLDGKSDADEDFAGDAQEDDDLLG